MRKLAVASALAACLACSAAAQERMAIDEGGYRLSGAATPGGLLVGKTQPGSRVQVDGESVPVATDGAFLVGFGRDFAKTQIELRVEANDGSAVETRILAVTPRQYDIQRIEGVEPRYVEPPPEVMANILEEQRLVREARGRRDDVSDFLGGFVWPSVGPISGVYGSQRVFNGKPRAPHLGVDIAAPRGTPVAAAGPGTVTLARKDLYFNGNAVIIDHGLGLSTVYVHLDEISVTEGQRVSRGQTIGKIGATGRVTGPHLHWGATLRGDALDPQLLVGPMPTK